MKNFAVERIEIRLFFQSYFAADAAILKVDERYQAAFRRNAAEAKKGIWDVNDVCRQEKL
jgi:hypothetical protein